MLFTRCPDCDTTFRVSDEALTKANGQVRCGRCASVFNAYAELREPPAEGDAPESATSRGKGAEQEPATTSSPGPEGKTASKPTTDDAPPQQATDAATARGDVDGLTVAEVVAEVAIGTREEDASESAGEGRADHASVSSITAAEIEEVLEAFDTSAVTAASLRLGPERRTRHGKLWTAAAALGTIVLAVQIVNHFRADLVVEPAIGAPLARAYALFGVKIIPHWNLKQYQILDWVANAEPNAHGQGSLKISARIHNRGARATVSVGSVALEGSLGGSSRQPRLYAKSVSQRCNARGETHGAGRDDACATRSHRSGPGCIWI